MDRGWKFGLMAALLCGAAPAFAGEEPLYQPAPAWVESVPLDQLTFAPGKAFALLDTQARLEDGKVWDFTDVVYLIGSPTDLNSGGTLSAAWIPDKGDLIIHRVEIIRGNEVIDLLAQGSRFTVLRREEMLERRQIDGVLTATLTVPGLRVGDSVRLAHTTVQADQALKDKVQYGQFLIAGEAPVGMARVRISWPDNKGFSWAAGPEAGAVETTGKDGYKAVEIKLPLAKPQDMPRDAPARYRRPTLLQVGNFESWEDLSRTLAPYYQTEGTIAPDGEIMGHVKRIKAASADPLERAAMALQVVQDDVSYLLNGLDGGNYLPQKPEDTWQLRYGDCKAKTLLLVAMLRELGIEADTVVVHSAQGDSVPQQLPLPGAFDHAIARAVIGGQDYWLDGTSLGGRLNTISEVPDFHYALPLTLNGSGLVKMVERMPDRPDRLVKLVVDQSAGIDLPALFELNAEFYGAAAASMQPLTVQTNEDLKKDFAQKFALGFFNSSQVLSYNLSYDDVTGGLNIGLKGIVGPNGTQWSFERGLGTMSMPGLEIADFAFNPDRSRPAWKQIPVVMAGSGMIATDIQIKLPDGGNGYRLRGSQDVDTEIAGIGIVRKATLDGNMVTVREQVTYSQQEIAADAVSAEKAKASRFSAGNLTVAAPREARRSWDNTAADKARLAPIESAYATLIERDPKDTGALFMRAIFRSSVLDWKGALADLAAVNEIRPTAAGYSTRAGIYSQLGEWDNALSEIRAAFEIEPTPDMAIVEAVTLADLGKYDEALSLIEAYEGDAQKRQSVLLAKADILGKAGRAQEGLAVIDELQGERPGDPDLLNASCWIMGVWQVQADDMLPICTKAVESAGWSPPVLDSRAMAYFRLGRLEEALADLNAALTAEPDMAPTLYMRGIVRKMNGDAKGAEDLARAQRIMPAVKETYARFGIKP